MIFTGSSIEVVRLLSLKAMLKLELKGMKRSRSPSAYIIIKRDLGLKGTRERVLSQLEVILENLQQGLCPPCNHDCNQGRTCPHRKQT